MKVVLSAVAIIMVMICFPLQGISAEILGDVIITTDTHWMENHYLLDNLTIEEGMTLSLDGGSTISATGSIRLRQDTVLLLKGKNIEAKAEGAWRGIGCALIAPNIDVESGGRISADEQGYLGAAAGETFGSGPGISDYKGYGGCYGAEGDPKAYGDAMTPREPGSGGNGYYTTTARTGNGGGSIRLVADTLTLDGEISANGGHGIFSGGGGSGGSVWATIHTLKGSGRFSADGGNRAAYGNEGTGGRIAVYYHDASEFSGVNISGARGGIQSNDIRGLAGSCGFIDMSVPEYHVMISNSPFFFRSILNLGRITADNSTLYMNENTTLTIGQNFLIGNKSTFHLNGGSHVAVGEELAVTTGSAVLVLSVNNKHEIDERWAGAGGFIRAGHVLVDATSKITADSKGYAAVIGLEGAGPGGGKILSRTGGGGGYGGRGADGSNLPGSGGQAYGSPLTPLDLGSAGGSTDGGSGGGAIMIETASLRLDGAISANGGNGPCCNPRAGGSGGSVFLVVHDVMSGAGKISANGGSASSSSGGGGGGRVAVYCWGAMDFPVENITVSGGRSGFSPYPYGEAGSIVVLRGPIVQWVSPDVPAGTGPALFHDTEWLEWSGYTGIKGQDINASVSAFSSGKEYFIADDRNLSNGVFWDTTLVPDGIYEIRVVFRDTANNNVETELSMKVMINNSIQWVGGTLGGNTVWTSDKVYIVEETIIIPDGVTLFIEPGTIVKFARRKGIIIEDGGILQAEGSALAAIIMTTLSDDSAGGDTNLDGNATIPVSGDWRGISTMGSGLLLDNDYTEYRYIIVTVSWAIAGNVTWRGKFTYHVTGDITVPDGSTLTIEPGAVVKFDPGLSLIIESGGYLIAHGTVAKPITFTSIRDDKVGGDTNEDANQSLPAAGDWNCLKCKGGVIDLDHVVIVYGGGPTGSWDNTGMVKCESGQILISNSIMSHSYYDGVILLGGNAQLTKCIMDHIDRAIQINGGSVQAVHCTLYKNRYGVFLHGGTLEMTNSIIAESLQYGMNLCCGSPQPTLSHNNVWGSGLADYISVTDPTGLNGNLSVDPRFKDAERSDFRLRYVSPMIDAADGTASPETDFFGAPRYDDPRTPNTGIAASVGAFTDMGAFEFVETMPSDKDLVVTAINGPTAVTAGDEAVISWTVSNLGSGGARGPWHDMVSIVRNSSYTSGTILLGEVSVGLNTVLGPGQSLTAQARFRIPAATSHYYSWHVTTNSRGEVYEGINSLNNTGVSETPVRIATPRLDLGIPTTGSFTKTLVSNWYAFAAATGQEYLLEMECDSSGSLLKTEVYLKYEGVPSPDDYDIRTSLEEICRHRVLIPSGTEGTWYILVLAPVAPISPVNYTITLTEHTVFELTGVSPSRCGDMGETTFEITGSGFTSNAKVYLTSDTLEIAARIIVVENSTILYATFETPGLPLTFFDVEVRDQRLIFGGEGSVAVEDVTSRLPRALRIFEGAGGSLDLRLETRGVARAGRPFDTWVVYANRGDADILSPLILLHGDKECRFTIEGDDYTYLGTAQILGISSSGPQNRLRPGQSEKVRVSVLAPVDVDAVDLELSLLAQTGAGLTTGPNVKDFMSDLYLPTETSWGNEVVSNLQDILGPNWVTYEQSLSRAVGLWSFDERYRSATAVVRRLISQAVYGIMVPFDETDPVSSQSSGAAASRLHADEPCREGMSKFDLPPYHTKFDPWPETWDYRHSAMHDSEYYDWLNFMATTSGLLPQFKYAARHLSHFLDNTGTPLIYDVNSDYSKIIQTDPGISNYLGVGMWRIEYQKLVQEIARDMDCGDTRHIKQQIEFHEIEGGLGVSWEKDEGQQGVGKVDSIFVDLDVFVSRGESSAVAVGTANIRLQDYYHWAGHGDYHDAKYSPPWNWWATYLEYYCLAKGFVIDIDLGEQLLPIMTSHMKDEKKCCEEGDPDYPDCCDPSREECVPDLAPPGPGCARFHVYFRKSRDPNEKESSGIGESGFIKPGETIHYTVMFENVSTATAAAAEVRVTDNLDSRLDWTSFEILEIRFNDQEILMSPGKKSFSGSAIVASDPQYPVQISAALNSQTGVLGLYLWSQDPLTRLLAEDPFAGFLPPNDDKHHGEGSIRFKVRVKDELPDGTIITNRAGIVFDVNPAIITNEAVNIIDSVPPVGTVDSLPPYRVSPIFTVSWSGEDQAGGSGADSFDVYVSTDGKPWVPWLLGVTGTEASFAGERAHSYAFHCVARDLVGNIEEGASLVEAATHVSLSAEAIMGHILGRSDITSAQILFGDLNEDGRIDVSDIVKFKQFSAGR